MKKILSLVLTCVMLLSVASLGVFANEGVTEIANAEQLAAITDGNYKLTADITATGTIASFSGTLDGNGHTITVSAPLFETVSGTVKNVTVSGEITTELTADLQAYALVAVTADGGAVFENVTTAGSVTVSKANGKTVSVGALIGRATLEVAEDTLTVTGCVNKANVSVSNTGKNGIGGFIGQLGQDRVVVNLPNGSATIKQCVNKGNVTVDNGGSSLGGIVGRTPSDGALYVNLIECANLGDVIGTNSTGEFSAGIIGYVRQATLSKCYNTGSIQNNKGAYGLIGYANLSNDAKRSLTIEYCYSATANALDAELVRAKNVAASTLTSNCYIDGRTAYQENIAKFSTSDVKCKDAAEILAALSAQGYVADEDNINGGYPILAFQVVEDEPEQPDQPDKPEQPEQPEKPAPTGDTLTVLMAVSAIAMVAVAVVVSKKRSTAC